MPAATFTSENGKPFKPLTTTLFFFSPHTFKNREKKWRQEDKWLISLNKEPPLLPPLFGGR